jgi:hypothetical protein
MLQRGACSAAVSPEEVRSMVGAIIGMLITLAVLGGVLLLVTLLSVVVPVAILIVIGAVVLVLPVAIILHLLRWGWRGGGGGRR